MTPTNKSSYTAASAFPIKLLSDPELVKRVQLHDIPPAHIQINPTNKCPGKCSFCSCRHRDRSLEMPLSQFKEIIKGFHKLGTRAATFTGGGDPLAHANINECLAYCFDLGISVGLVTEGTFLNRLDPGIAKNISWARVSVSDERPIDDEMAKFLTPGVEWGLSYVLTSNPRWKYLIGAIEFANKNGLTHVRVATDILSEEAVDIASAKTAMITMGVDISKVIWQDRATYCKGVKRCLLSLLKPNVTPDGHLTGCCGSQYSSIPPMLDWPRKLYMDGTIEEIFEKQNYYDGSQCQRCYYCDYNDVLNALWDSADIKHGKFV